jgi:hypothetical protein
MMPVQARSGKLAVVSATEPVLGVRSRPRHHGPAHAAIPRARRTTAYYLRRYWRRVIVAYVATVAVTLLTLVVPPIMGWVVDLALVLAPLPALVAAGGLYARIYDVQLKDQEAYGVGRA